MEDDKIGRNIKWCDTAGLGDACQVQAEMAAKSIQDAIDEAQKSDRGTACFKIMNILKYRNIKFFKQRLITFFKHAVRRFYSCAFLMLEEYVKLICML